MGAGRKWTAEDDVILSRSVVHIGVDSITGADQKGSVYWGKVVVFFNDNVTHKRTQCAIMNHWAIIQADVNKFVGHYRTMAAVEKSGWKMDEDYIKATLEVFEKLEGGPFQYQSCWDYLRQNTKWEEVCVGLFSPKPKIKREKRPMKYIDELIEIEDEKDAESKTCNNSTRPVGRDTMKDFDNIANKRLKYMDRMSSASVARNDLIAEQNEIALFSAKDDDASKEYILILNAK